MSGLELLRRLRSNGSDVPVILLADESDVPTAVAAMREGATDFIEKPYVSVAILKQVQKLLHGQGGATARLTAAARRHGPPRQLARGKAVGLAVPRRSRTANPTRRIAELFRALAGAADFQAGKWLRDQRPVDAARVRALRARAHRCDARARVSARDVSGRCSRR